MRISKDVVSDGTLPSQAHEERGHKDLVAQVSGAHKLLSV
jgi:hypothetical protein